MNSAKSDNKHSSGVSSVNFLKPSVVVVNNTLVSKSESLENKANLSVKSKVALAPGRGLLDWVRRCKSGEDLSGLHGKPLRSIEPFELSKHNTPDDCWMALHGRVYNVSAYMEYHPGGVDELMKGAGIDATDLFNSIHRWVNAESMLKTCLVGFYGGTESLSVVSSGSKAIKKMSAIEGSWDWEESKEAVTFLLQMKRSNRLEISHVQVVPVSFEGTSDEEQQRTLAFRIFSETHTYQIVIVLHNELMPHSAVVTCDLKESGLVRVAFTKKVVDSQIRSVGRIIKETYTHIQEVPRVCWISTRVISCTLLTHDTQLICLELPDGARCPVPSCWHVHIRRIVQGEEIIRAYTPVLSSLLDNDEASNNLIYLFVKVYENGALTPSLTEKNLSIGDFIDLGPPEPGVHGLWTTKLLPVEVSHICLLAAGSGITPMVKLWRDALIKMEHRHVNVLFFNKTVQDIPWREELEDVVRRFPNRFTLHHVLSQPDADWSGARGRISVELLAVHVKRWLSAVDGCVEHLLVCQCGPPSFVKLAVQLLIECGIPSERLHTFDG